VSRALSGSKLDGMGGPRVGAEAVREKHNEQIQTMMSGALAGLCASFLIGPLGWSKHLADRPDRVLCTDCSARTARGIAVSRGSPGIRIG
jgi:hypothetical protein